MAIHKLHIDEFDEIDYQLIAIHTSLEDYRLAYYINQKLPVSLSKSKNEILIKQKEGETPFSRFIFEDEKAAISWNLIQNKNNLLLAEKSESEGLFANTKSNFSKNVYFLPEFKKVDYFLKIENADETLNINKITNIMNSIDRISTVYPIEIEKIKSKNNLIF